MTRRTRNPEAFTPKGERMAQRIRAAGSAFAPEAVVFARAAHGAHGLVKKSWAGAHGYPNPDEDEVESTQKIRYVPPKPPPSAGKVQPGPLPGGRHRRVTEKIPYKSVKDSLEEMKSNPRQHCEYVVGPDGRDLLLCLERKA